MPAQGSEYVLVVVGHQLRHLDEHLLLLLLIHDLVHLHRPSKIVNDLPLCQFLAFLDFYTLRLPASGFLGVE
jgi:hypothetical protein